MRTDDNTPHDDEVGRELRDVYRRIATETAPSHLDEAVLAAARTSRPPAGAGLWRWRRPLAWVTMIGLSFAIVLEFNQTGTDVAPAVLQDDAPAPVATDEASSAEGRSRFAPEPARPETDTADRARQALEEAVATETEAEKRSRDEELEVMSAPAPAELRESDAAADMEPEPPATAAAPAAGALGKAAPDPAQRLRADADRQADLYIDRGTAGEPACDEATRADPERWRACIRDLLDAERAGEALVEIGLYRQAFPNEPPPVEPR